MRPKQETYPEARARLLEELGKYAGISTKPTLKVPQAKLTNGEILYFRPRAVYLEAHSLWIDIRGMNLRQFLEVVEHARQIRNKAQEAGESGLVSAHLLVRSSRLPLAVTVKQFAKRSKDSL